MPAPICVQCQVEMRCKLNDQPVNDLAVGNFPATYWLGDLMECPCCAFEIVLGFGRELSSVAGHPNKSIAFARDAKQRQQYAHRFRKIDISKE